MEAVLEIICEIFGEVFLEIICGILGYIAKGYLPKKFIKREHKKLKTVVAIMSISEFLALLTAVIMLIVNDGRSIFGWILLSLSVVYIVLGIILALLRKIRFYDFDE
ncbi:MAG: hypothetical protein J6A85_04250 [Clostridia bacterium]|nr:hypothetical protein [Clostridia bacterium]